MKRINRRLATVATAVELAYTLADMFENDEMLELLTEAERNVRAQAQERAECECERAERKRKRTEEERRYYEQEQELLDWLTDPANWDDECYSDIYKDVYGFRPRWR